MGRFFLFREVSPGETSPKTWGFEEAKDIKVKVKVPPHRLPPRSDSPTNQPIKEVYAQMRTLSRNKTIAKEYMQAIIQWVSTSCNYLTSI
jgi:hypothetical protein